jgi:hypothetical protein
MTDQFDFNRKVDNAAGVDADGSLDRLDADKEKARLRAERLIQLDERHFYDPLDQWVLFKDGSQFRKLSHSVVYQKLAAAKVEAQARELGFQPLEGGLFWHAGTKDLYVKNGKGYVLYSVDPLTVAS